MKLLYRAANGIEANSLHDLLSRAGIDAVLKNATTSFFPEGAIHVEGMPELWVEDAALERALSVKQDWLRLSGAA
jgi:hypothetical protein